MDEENGLWSTGNRRASMRVVDIATLTVRRHHESARWTATVDVGVEEGPRVTGLVSGSIADAQAWCDRWAAVVLAEVAAQGD